MLTKVSTISINVFMLFANYMNVIKFPIISWLENYL